MDRRQHSKIKKGEGAKEENCKKRSRQITDIAAKFNDGRDIV